MISLYITQDDIERQYVTPYTKELLRYFASIDIDIIDFKGYSAMIMPKSDTEAALCLLRGDWQLYQKIFLSGDEL